MSSDSHISKSKIARICHEANRAYCLTLNDHSQVPWTDAPDWQVDSAINGVTFALTASDPQPADSHVSWLKQKEAEGWTYGPIKDPALKQHPCMVPYDQLPASQKVKDKLFLAICNVFKSDVINID